MIKIVIIAVVVVVLVWGGWRLRDRFEILGEFLAFLRERKLWWLLPMVIVFVIAGLFVVFAGQSPLGYAIYSLF